MLTEWVNEELAVLDETAMRRRLRASDETLIHWGSNNYLGLAKHPRVIAGAQAALAAYGAGATASRLIQGQAPLHQALESDLAQFFSRDAALVFPSGYMANLGAVTALVGPGDAIIMDRLCHASLIDAARLSGARLFVYPHIDLDGAKKALKRTVGYHRRLLLTESLFSMDGDFAPLKDLIPLAHQHGAMVLVDEAHGLGVWPHTDSAQADVLVGTLSKALGAQGGFVAASFPVIDWLVNKARPFIFTTGLAPACVGAAQAALALIKEGDTKAASVLDLAGELRIRLQALGWDTGRSHSQIIPILVGSASRALALAEQAKAAGHLIPAIRPPTVPEGECRVRISVTAEHTQADVDGLLNLLEGTR